MVWYPALIVVSFPGCRIWAGIIIFLWLFSGHWKERFALLRSERFLTLTVIYLGFACLGILYSSASLSETLKEWHGRQTMIVVPVLLTLLYHCPERRPQMICVLNLSVAIGFLFFLAMYFWGTESWYAYRKIHKIYFFKNSIGAGISLTLWAGLWICYPFCSREIPWIRRLLPTFCVDGMDAASRLHPWTIVREVFQRRLPCSTVFFSLIRWGVVLSVVYYLFCVNSSRTAQLSLLCSCVLLLILWNPRQGLVYSLLFSFLVLPAAYFLSPSFKTKILRGWQDVQMFTASLSSGNIDELERSREYRRVADGRLLLYEGLVEKIMERPIFGYGMGSTEEVCREANARKILNPHNEYLCVAVQSGFVGLSIYLLWLGGSIVLVFRLPSPWKQLGVLTITTLVIDGCFNCALSFSSASRYYGIILAMIFSEAAIARRAESKAVADAAFQTDITKRAGDN